MAKVTTKKSTPVYKPVNRKASASDTVPTVKPVIKRSESYNYDDARTRAQAQNKRVAAGSGEKLVQGKDIEKEMKSKRKQFKKDFYAGTIGSRSELRDSIRTTLPKDARGKDVRKAMPWSATGEVLRTAKKIVKKGVKQNVIAPVGGLVRKVTTAQMNKGCPPKGQ